ncbi:MAG: thioredoxin-disulfide reductase [Alphaproteobacteria bacterium]|nr:thioredoxin-disulfide reductase [Alphaproteobacteria bacterium]
MTQTKETKVLIIGSGPAGYTAAIYAARANLEPILVTGMDQGGQLMITTDVENYPGFAEPIQGPWLMEQMKLQAEHVGAKIINDYVNEVDLSERPFRAICDSGDVYSGQTLIIATGAKAQWLGLPSEETFKGRGVSACATCDGFFFRDKDVAVVGGGNSAVEEALFLTNSCKSVTLIHRRDTLRSEKIMQERLFANKKVNILWNKVVEEIIGDDSGMTGLKLKDTQSGEISTIEKHGVFIAIGHKPETGMFKDKLDTDKEGYLITKADSTATSTPGVFAAGDVADNKYRQAVTAAAMGCMAALEADRFLGEQK